MLFRSNMKLFLAEEKEWRVGELNRLAVALRDARAEMRKKGLDKAKEYAMCFRWSAIFLICEKLSGIDLYEIDFSSLKGNNVVDPNDGSTTSLVKKANGDEEDGGSDVAEDVKEVLRAQSVPKETIKDPSPIDANVSLPLSGELVPPPHFVDNEAPKRAENL